MLRLPAVVLLLLAAPAAADVGEIAVIEDSNGLIMPASGFCNPITYPRGLCLPAAGLAFFRDHPDEFDALVVATTKPLPALTDPKAAAPLGVVARGIGMDVPMYLAAQCGSAGRLQVGVALGSLASMPDDPQELYGWPVIRGVEIVAHEIAHRWLAYVKVDTEWQAGSDILRGAVGDEGGGNHWSCWFNTGGSIQYGGILTDNGDGTFTDRNGPRLFSPLDQYLMGIRAPDEVPPMWYVRVGYSLNGCGDLPGEHGPSHTFTGDRYDFTIDDVISANGARDPASGPCHLKVGFVLVVPAGQTAPTAAIDKMNAYRLALEQWWMEATDGRGSLDTSLSGCGTGTGQCPGAQSPHCLTTGCDEGDTRCSGKTAVEACHEGLWTVRTECPAGWLCEEGRCMAPDGDADGVDGDAVPIDGDADRELSEQPSDGDGEPAREQEAETVCRPDELRCNEPRTLLLRCHSNGSGWDVELNCAADGLVCDEGTCRQGQADGDGDGEQTHSGGCGGTGPVTGLWLAVGMVLVLARRRRDSVSLPISMANGQGRYSHHRNGTAAGRANGPPARRSQ